jgi:hypothetical protein
MNYGVKVIASFLLISIAIFSYAGYLDDWTDDQICGWMENPSPPEHMVQEAVKRNLDCAPESAKKKAQEDTGLQIMIYDADFSDSDSDELSQTFENNSNFSEDFENGANVIDWANNWFIKKEKDGNSIYCNKPLDDWSGFQFGNDNWSDYSMSLRMIFPVNEKSRAEVYIRINDANEGYRVYVSNNYPVSHISFYPPHDRFGGGNILVKRNEWFEVKLNFSGNSLIFLQDGNVVDKAQDDRKSHGRAGVGAHPNTQMCVDDIFVKPI